LDDLRPPLGVVLGKVAAACDRAGVRYAIIGGVAANAYGLGRVTRDADFVVELAPGDPAPAGRLARELLHEGFRFSPEMFEARLARGASLFFLHLGLVRADLLFARPDRPALEHRRVIEYEGRRLWFASPEDVVALKLVAGRPRDLEDARGILAVKRDRLDRARLRATAADLARKTGRAALCADLERLIAEADAIP
jgi:hypothetical protein